MKKTSKMVAVVLCFVLCMSQMVVNASDVGDESITMEEIHVSGEEIVEISDEELFFPDSTQITPESTPESTAETKGKYPIYTRVVKKKSSSNGIIEKSSKKGLLSSIASTVLSFKLKGVVGMAVSTILSVTQIVASENQYVQAKTYVSYVTYEKNGQARWSTDKNFSTWVISAKRNYYKHVLGGKQLSSGKWTTNTKDYLSKPVKSLTGNYYGKSDTWFKNTAKERIQSGSLLVDEPY